VALYIGLTIADGLVSFGDDYLATWIGERPCVRTAGHPTNASLYPWFVSRLWPKVGRMTRAKQRAQRGRGRHRPKVLPKSNSNGFGWPLTDRPESITPMASTPPTARPARDPRAEPPPAGDVQTQISAAPRSRSLSLLWLVFLANSSVLVIALLLLTFSPIEIDAPIKTGQFALLLGGFVVLVGLNLLILRRVLAPLVQLTELMSSCRSRQAGPAPVRSQSAQRGGSGACSGVQCHAGSAGERPA
jgi:hypothetical protein